VSCSSPDDTRYERLDERLRGIHGQQTDYWSELAKVVVTGVTECTP